MGASSSRQEQEHQKQRRKSRLGTSSQCHEDHSHCMQVAITLKGLNMWDTWCGSRTTVCIDGAKLWGSSWTNLTFRNHTSSWPFLNPVDRKAVPDYYEHVKFPMDMKTMAERLKANYYVNKRLFIADMKRMFTNCRSVLYQQWCPSNAEWPGPTMLPKQSTTTVQTSLRGFSTTSAKTTAFYMGAMAIEVIHVLTKSLPHRYA